MVITLLNKDFVATDIVDDYNSFIWTDRYNSPGDFEYYAPMTKERFDKFKPGLYLANTESEHTMVIENVEIISDPEEGNNLKVTGRSIESFLDRRVLIDYLFVKDHNRIWKIIRSIFSNFTTGSHRRIPGFTFIEPTDNRVLDLRLFEGGEYVGDNALELINTFTQDLDLGYKLIHTPDGKYNFELYLGDDKTDENPLEKAVIFSPFFDNILNSDYTEDHTTYKNVAYVGGKDEGEGYEKHKITVSVTTSKEERAGLSRREMWVDGEADENEDDYYEALRQCGMLELKKCKVKQTFEGEVDVNGLFRYGRDFKIGDIITFENEYANKAKVRVEELIFSDDENGYTNYPSFTILNEMEDD